MTVVTFLLGKQGKGGQRRKLEPPPISIPMVEVGAAQESG